MKKYEVSAQGKRRLLLRLIVTAPFFIGLTAFIVWYYLIRDWPSSPAEGVGMSIIGTVILLGFVLSSVRYVRLAYVGGLDVVFADGTVTFYGAKKIKPEDLHVVGAIKAPFQQERLIVKVRRKKRILLQREFRIHPIQVGQHSEPELLKEAFKSFAGKSK